MTDEAAVRAAFGRAARRRRSCVGHGARSNVAVEGIEPQTSRSCEIT